MLSPARSRSPAKPLAEPPASLGRATEQETSAAQPPNGCESSVTAAGSRPSEPSTHSEDDRSSLLRASRALDAIQIATTYDRKVHFHLHAGQTPVLSGTWDWELTVRGKQVKSSNEWTNVCWETNRDVVYSELQLELGSDLQIQRQILLARRDHFVFLADALIGTSEMDGEFRTVLPLAAGVRGTAVEETREQFLFRGRRPIATALPLSLGEWRREKGGDFDASTTLALTQSFQGRRTHAALFIDLDPNRRKKQLTWRHLTVAESLQIVGRDVAVGYRVQIGREQWLIYRSLAPAGNRTVLGQNFSTEFIIARFGANGTAEKMLEIIG